jgi:hypothetical protein
MVDVEFVGQIVDSMEKGVVELEKAVEGKNFEYAAKLKSFLYDLQKRMIEALEVKDV